MDLFKYNIHKPTPTDKYAILIHKQYKKFMQETLEIWKKGVISQLMMQRDYIDLAEARIKLASTKDGIAPIISLKPVVSLDFEEKIELYCNFFRQYSGLSNRIIAEIFCIIREYDDNNTDPNIKSKVDKKYLIGLTNGIKALIASFNKETYHPDLIQVIMNDPLSAEAANAVRTLEVGHVVGGDFTENSVALLSCEADSDLIGSFYKYVRKKML